MGASEAEDPSAKAEPQGRVLKVELQEAAARLPDLVNRVRRGEDVVLSDGELEVQLVRYAHFADRTVRDIAKRMGDAIERRSREGAECLQQRAVGAEGTEDKTIPVDGAAEDPGSCSRGHCPLPRS